MDAISSVSTTTVPSPAVSVNATSVAGSASKTEEQAAASPAPETAFSKNKDRFYELVNTVLNEAGSFSLDDRLKAFSSIQDMGLKGQLMGSGGVEACFFANFFE